MLIDGLSSGGAGSKTLISAVCFGVKSMTADLAGSGVEGRVGTSMFLVASSALKSNSKLVRRFVLIASDMVVVVKKKMVGCSLIHSFCKEH
jgi:hypothetical protein